jgi:hypothetical protein
MIIYTPFHKVFIIHIYDIITLQDLIFPTVRIWQHMNCRLVQTPLTMYILAHLSIKYKCELLESMAVLCPSHCTGSIMADLPFVLLGSCYWFMLLGSCY